MSVACVVVGLIRDAAQFEQSLAMLSGLRRDGLVSRIIISTWNEELVESNTVSLLSDKYKCQVVSSSDPGTVFRRENGIKSSVGPQTIGLRQALMLVEDDDFVLKMRPDTIFKEIFLRNLLSSSASRDFDAPPGSPLQKKIWVPWADLLFPFLIADECFLGRCGDLKLMATDFYQKYDPGAQAHVHAESCHVLRHLAPFASGVFKDFHRNWIFLQYESPVLSGGWTEYLMLKFKTRLWWVMIAKYVSILCDNYIIDGGQPGDITFYVKCGDRQNRSSQGEICHFYPGTMIPVNINENTFVENIMATRARVLILNDMKWLRNIRYGHITSDSFYDTVFAPAMLQMQGFESRNEIPDLGAGIMETVKAAKADADFSVLSRPEWTINWVA